MVADRAAFEWYVASHGYDWQHMEHEPNLLLVPRPAPNVDQLPGRKNFPVKRYAPLLEHTGLFRTFGCLALSEDDILRFANKHGSLTHYGTSRLGIVSRENPGVIYPLSCGEGELFWRREIVEMRSAVKLFDLVGDGNKKELSRYIRWTESTTGKPRVLFDSHPDLDPKVRRVQAQETEEISEETIASEGHLLRPFEPGDVVGPARACIARLIDRHLEKKIGSSMKLDAEGIGIHFKFVPEDLLSAMWLQFALGASADRKYRACSVCETWFELSPETARTSRLFCSNPCKSRGYREKQDRARQMFAEGKTFRVIAKELESEIVTVKRWITGKKG